MLMTAIKEYKELPTKFDISEYAKFEVKTRPIYDINQVVIPDKKQAYRTDTGDGLAVVSKSYVVRPYEKAINHINDLILNSNLNLDDVEIRDTVDNNGAVYLRNYRFNQIKGVKMFDNPLERSIFELQFRSSHNLRFAEDLIAFARYLFCDNGCSSVDWKLHVRTKHNTAKDVKKDYTAIDEAVANFIQSEEEKKQWVEKTIAFLAVKELFRRTLAYQIPLPNINHVQRMYSEFQMETLMRLYKKYTDRYGENLFAVFQTATDWSTHVETKGKVYNVQDRRNGRVHQMMNHDIWKESL